VKGLLKVAVLDEALIDTVPLFPIFRTRIVSLVRTIDLGGAGAPP
jgi:hypothetical protein